MIDDKAQAVVVLLAHDALEAADDNSGIAALLLIDAALTILVSRLRADGAREMAGMLSEYVTTQADAAIRNGGARG